MSHRSTSPQKRNDPDPQDDPRPAKPYDGFPLRAHGNGQWCKKIRGKRHYFGSWRDDPEGTKALAEFNRQWPYLSEGKAPPPPVSDGGCTLADLVNAFLDTKESQLEADELSPRTFRDYHRSCGFLVEHIGRERRVENLRPDDFADLRAMLARRFSPITLRNEITRMRTVFLYAAENELIEKPVRFGQEFSRPSAKQLRRQKNQAGPKLFTREEITALITAADVHLRAMIYLGINAGFGNTDVATLPITAVDLDAGWVNFPRPKTEINRRVPLWPETVAALRESLAERPAPHRKEHAGLCFLTRKQGHPWVRVKLKKLADGKTPGPKDQVVVDAVALQFGKLLRTLKINGRRGLGFYSFRHSFATHAGESRDQVAVDALMGHVDPSMGGNYRHRISDERLRAVVDTVRAWLFPPSNESTPNQGAPE